MPLQIRDETANTIVLTIDDTGLICFGNGTPVSALSITGTAVVDSNGLITNQRVNSATLISTSGIVSCDPGETTSVSTSPGKLSTVQLDSQWPAYHSTYRPATDSVSAQCLYTYLYTQQSHQVISLDVGSFTIQNKDQPDEDGQCIPAGHGPYTSYRWF